MLNSFEKTSLPPNRPSTSGHPDDVVHDGTLTLAKKRAILASWASDAHAVVDAPTLRQLDNGAVIELDVILRALRSLDGEDDAGDSVAARSAANPRRWRSATRYEAILTRWRRKSGHERRRDDDDDPPPCPASSALPVPPRFVPAYGRSAA